MGTDAKVSYVDCFVSSPQPLPTMDLSAYRADTKTDIVFSTDSTLTQRAHHNTPAHVPQIVLT